MQAKHVQFHTTEHHLLGYESLAWYVVNGSDSYSVGGALGATAQQAEERAELDLQRVARKNAAHGIPGIV